MARSVRTASRSTTRRRFLTVAGAAGLSAVLVPAVALAQSAPRRRTIPKPPPVREPVAPAKPDSAAKPAAESEFVEDVKALTAVIRRRYGKHLDEKQLEAIAKELDGRMQSGKALRAAKLANGDEPDVVFHA